MLNGTFPNFLKMIGAISFSGITALGSFLAPNVPNQVTLIRQSAIILPILSDASSLSSPSSTILGLMDLPEIAPGLLPTTTIPFCPASSTCGIDGLRHLLRSLGLATSPRKPERITAAPKKTPVAINASQNTLAGTTPIIAPQPISAVKFLDATTPSFHSTFDGSYELVMTTALPGQAPIEWNLLSQTVGNGMMNFSMTSSCTPIPTQPDVTLADKNPRFDVRTLYTCSISLTPQSGSDRRTQTKDFSFTTPPGEFIVSSDLAMNNLLVNNTNDGGIVFQNNDSQPVTITGITLSASYAYLVHDVSAPLILRIQNPATGISLADYPLNSLPADPTATNAYHEDNITLPISVVVPAHNKKLLPLQVLGVEKMLVLDTTPTIKITLTGLTTNNNIKPVLHNPTASWSCIVSSQTYDPSQLSGAYATGQACLK